MTYIDATHAKKKTIITANFESKCLVLGKAHATYSEIWESGFVFFNVLQFN